MTKIPQFLGIIRSIFANLFKRSRDNVKFGKQKKFKESQSHLIQVKFLIHSFNNCNTCSGSDFNIALFAAKKSEKIGKT